MSQKVAVVTGSNKGIGLAIVKLLLQRFDGAVYLTSRDDARGKAAVEQLQKLGLQPAYHQLDVADPSSVAKFRDHINQKHGGLDILINNAGVVNFDDSYEAAMYIIDINYYSFYTLQELIYPLVRKNGRIINVSSDCGHLSNVRNKHWIDVLSKKDITEAEIDEFVQWFLESKKNGTFDPNDIADNATIAAYRVSKVALCALTMVQQRQLKDRNISVNSMHPGFVQTDMTRNLGFSTTDEAAETPVYLALDAPATLQGAYVWYNKEVRDWHDYKTDLYFNSANLVPDGKLDIKDIDAMRALISSGGGTSQ